jgi:hypothetical protein
MKRIGLAGIAGIAGIAAIGLIGLASGLAGQAGGSGWDTVEGVFGQPGKDQPGGVRRFGWPRTDLRVSLAGVPIEAALALGSWAAFQKSGAGDEAVAMGDLALLEAEVEPVVEELQAGGLEILAIHNHLNGETPRILYVHFHGHGDAAALARALKAALSKTKTPSRGKPPAKPTRDQERMFAEVQEALGRKGALAGAVLQVGVPRPEPIVDGGREVPPGMGMAIAMNFETVGARVATTGDFVLIADEVNPVIRELTAHGIAVTALHSHMLRESPRLFFLHFWGVDAPRKIGEALKAALAKTAAK